MAIIACQECTHQVSDRAASCPNCGAPIAPVRTKPRGKRIISRVLSTLAALWMVAATLWVIATIMAPNQIGMIRASVQRVEQSKSTHRSALADHTSSMDHSLGRPKVAPPRRVYHTTTEQLYQDYNTNEVATQSKIGDSRIRVTGSVAEIDQDALGHPVVKLSSRNDNSAVMTLSDDQHAAAAQLAKGETVDIECDKMRRIVAAPQGSDCTLALVDAGPRMVNLAVVLSNDRGTARVYVVGPMSEATCLARSEGISQRLSANLRGDHVASKDCTSTTLESIPPEGCHLISSISTIPDSISTIPDVPAAQLWRYDCALPTVPPLRARKSAATSRKDKPLMAATAPAAPDLDTESATARTSAPVQSRADTAARPTPVPVEDPVSPEAAPLEPPSKLPVAAAGPVGVTTAPALSSAESAATNAHVAPGVSTEPATGNAAAAIQRDEATVTHAPPVSGNSTAAQGVSREPTPPPAAKVSSDDLATVRATDPQAAEHIASHCASMVASANRDVLAAECRRREIDAWTRLVLHNEFPTLDDATRRKCNEPPFPDTYVAKERCAKYVLQMNQSADTSRTGETPLRR
jgi:tRNA_anti-like